MTSQDSPRACRRPELVLIGQTYILVHLQPIKVLELRWTWDRLALPQRLGRTSSTVRRPNLLGSREPTLRVNQEAVHERWVRVGFFFRIGREEGDDLINVKPDSPDGSEDMCVGEPAMDRHVPSDGESVRMRSPGDATQPAQRLGHLEI